MSKQVTALLGAIIIMMAFDPQAGVANEHGEAHPAEHQASSSESASKPVSKPKPNIFVVIYRDFMQKLEDLKNLDQDNETLREKAARLEIENARLEHENLECHETDRAEEIKTHARKEGGVETARTVASLKVSDPKLLSQPPKVIFEGALRAFDKGDFETAAKALITLADNPENDAYQTPQANYLAGVSLFKLGNFKLAQHYLRNSYQQALEKRGSADLTYAPRALAWLALSHAKLGDKTAEKNALRELIQRFPKSKEARRFNRGEV